MAFHIARKLGPLGAEIGGVDLSRPLDDATARAIRDAWLENLVLVFHGQALDDAAFVAFSGRFGRLEQAPIAERDVGVVSLARLPEVTVVSNVVENGVPLGSLGNSELSWHSDMTYLPSPPPASILYGVDVQPGGADTWFNNMYLVYERLPGTLRRRAEGLRANHTASYTSAGTLRVGFEQVTDPSTAPGAFHPMVITHPATGRKALYLGRRQNAYVEGLPLAESEALLDEVWSYVTRETAVSHPWSRGDIVMWDNRCVMHRRDALNASARRTMHRTQLLSFELRAAL